MAEQFITATVYVLLHSLWQGMFIALMLAAYVKLPVKSGSKSRYSVSFISLLTVVVTSVATFIYYIKDSAVEASAGSYAMKEITYAAVKDTSSLSVWAGTFENYSGLILTLWFSGMTVFFIKFCVDLYYTDMLRKKDCSVLSDEAVKVFRIISEKFGIKRTVQFLESPLAKVPAAIGYFKPVVIIPLGLAMKIPSDQLEAVISHELAHIARNDFMHNLIQTVIEIVYFFNPSVLWISKTIRTERENACDDLAVTQCKDPALLARGLYSLGLLNATMPETAMAATGGKNLLCRIKRIIKKENDMTRTYSGFVASIIVMFLEVTIITGCTLFGGTKDEVKEEKVKTVIVNDGGGDKNEKIIVVKKNSDDGKEVNMDITVDEDSEGIMIDGDKMTFTNKDGKTIEIVINKENPEEMKKILKEAGLEADMMIIDEDDDDVMVWTTSGDEKEIKKVKKIKMKVSDKDEIEANKWIKKINDSDFDDLWKNLIADGIFKEKSDNLKIEIEDDEIEINGKEIPEKLLEKYKKLLEDK